MKSKSIIKSILNWSLHIFKIFIFSGGIFGFGVYCIGIVNWFDFLVNRVGPE
jgi:hypothetical protein